MMILSHMSITAVFVNMAFGYRGKIFSIRLLKRRLPILSPISFTDETLHQPVLGGMSGHS